MAAVFSTASAINATLLATARLAHRVGKDGQLPAGLTWALVGTAAALLAVRGVDLAVRSR